MALRIHGDLTSQPTRAVLSFCNLTNITYTFVQHLIHKEEHRSQEFLRLNPLGYMPVIEDGEFKLAESHAIMTYLHATRGCPDHWYPRDYKARAVVDRYLHWHHSHLRSLAPMVKHRFEALRNHTDPALNLPLLSQQKALQSLEILDKTLQSSSFIAGNQITIADISAVCEISQGQLINLDLSAYPHLSVWYQGVYSLEGVKRVHTVMEKLHRKYHPSN